VAALEDAVADYDFARAAVVQATIGSAGRAEQIEVLEALDDHPITRANRT
jgi:hypothetical protein